MKPVVRRLNASDIAVLELLDAQDADFDIDGRGEPHGALPPAQARAYLGDPSVLFWIAEEGPAVVGFMSCHVLRKRCGETREVLLYEIGVRRRCRRQGVGRALFAQLQQWMEQEVVSEVWVLADNPTAVAYYQACGFQAHLGASAPTYLTRA